MSRVVIACPCGGKIEADTGYRSGEQIVSVFLVEHSACVAAAAKTLAKQAAPQGEAMSPHQEKDRSS